MHRPTHNSGGVGREVRLRSYPTGPVTPGDFHVVEAPVSMPTDGQVLVRNTWTSVDPGMRLRLSAAAGWAERRARLEGAARRFLPE